jgi:hypothetical protein
MDNRIFLVQKTENTLFLEVVKLKNEFIFTSADRREFENVLF